MIAESPDHALHFQTAVIGKFRITGWMHPIAEHEILPDQDPPSVAFIVKFSRGDMPFSPYPKNIHLPMFREVQQPRCAVVPPAVGYTLHRRPTCAFRKMGCPLIWKRNRFSPVSSSVNIAFISRMPNSTVRLSNFSWSMVRSA